MAYAGGKYWDSYFRELRDSGDDLDWGTRWVEPFLTPLREAGVRSVLELGCGTGNDAARLAREGYSLSAIDLSTEAIDRARDRFGSCIDFAVADMAKPLPFEDETFDAVMSNVALHMFSDGVTRAVFAEVARVLAQGGLFLFHVNALEDRPLRERRRPVARELEQDYVLEQDGQTMHFFSGAYLRELLQDWRKVRLDRVEIADRKTGAPFKRVWRGVAHR